MSHYLLKGTIHHKRFHPKTHQFKYRFFMMDIDLNMLENLKNRLLSISRFNLFGFYAKDHFGKSNSFLSNAKSLVSNYSDIEPETTRFVTLPRMLGFVFNPISLLILYRQTKPYFMLVEVHNYDGGRIVYPVELIEKEHQRYHGTTHKDMYVSPFFERTGTYDFMLYESATKFLVNITYKKENVKLLTATLDTTRTPYTEKSLLNAFFLYPFQTLGVVVFTIWQSLKLRIKGLQWHDPLPIDQLKRS